ncbi:hypothetical protein KIV56_00920 [Cryobacterium breve]|uniref:Helicase-associated domain-containing protein n=1 Tax=Cryobacterium breve TaxID=1259258 RepID=A0ABY7NF50_9MICO|nr:hypothetical protein KIV56_00920 [Cryobacterium breve]
MSVNGHMPKKNDRVLQDTETLRLANFAAGQRRRRSGLSPEQEAALEAIPGFAWSPGPDAWNANVQDFGTFFLEHKKVPTTPSADPREVRLAVWAGEQRALRRGNGTRNPPSAERQAQLENVPGWEWEPVAHKLNARVEELAAFITREGRPPRRPKSPSRASLSATQFAESSLSTWLSNQRQRERQGKLDSELRARIERILGKPLNP